jgi:hypothetical protein
LKTILSDVENYAKDNKNNYKWQVVFTLQTDEAEENVQYAAIPL